MSMMMETEYVYVYDVEDEWDLEIQDDGKSWLFLRYFLWFFFCFFKILQFA